MILLFFGNLPGGNHFIETKGSLPAGYVDGWGAIDFATGKLYSRSSGAWVEQAAPVSFASLSGKPTTLSGYGITDAAANAHSHAQSDITGLTAALTGKEPANANIQSHIASAHAPSNAQANADITKAEIEAKLTGVISSHSHAGGGGGATYTDFTKNIGKGTSGFFDITGLSGLTADKVVNVVQTCAPIASKGNARDEPEMDLISLTGYVLNTTTIRCYWNSQGVVTGTYAFAYLVSS